MPLLGRADPIVTGGLKGGLLSVARPIPGSVEWEQGVNFNSDCGTDVGYSVCFDPEDATDKNISTVGDGVEFTPFMLYHGTECSTWLDTAELLALARSGFVRGESAAFARQLQSDAAGTGNPSLNNVASVLPGTADVVNVLSALISAVCECGFGDVVFHTNIRALPFLKERHLVHWEDGSAEFQGGPTETPGWYFGPYKFDFDCYGATGPGDVDEEEDGSNVWIYATGPIEIASSQELVAPGQPTVRTNVALQLVESLNILRFDPCCVKAALAVLF